MSTNANNIMDTRMPPIESAVQSAGRKLALETGEKMAVYVTNRLLQDIRDVFTEAEAAGVKKENAVACFIHLCWRVCEELRGPAEAGEGLN